MSDHHGCDGAMLEAVATAHAFIDDLHRLLEAEHGALPDSARIRTSRRIVREYGGDTAYVPKTGAVALRQRVEIKALVGQGVAETAARRRIRGR